jgi:hypothetical protein
MRRELTCSTGAVFTAIALGIATGHAQELEQVTTVFKHAIPNIAGKTLIALVVSYPPGGKSASHRHAGFRLHLRSCAVRGHSQPG